MIASRLVPALLLALLSAAPLTADAQACPPALTREMNTPLVIAGAITFGTIFIVGIPVTAAIGENGEATGLMAIPLFGPFLVGALEPITNAQGVALGASAVIQSVGLTMLIIGLATDRVIAPQLALGDDPEAPVLSLSSNGFYVTF